jgi:hypothetical protein
MMIWRNRHRRSLRSYSRSNRASMQVPLANVATIVGALPILVVYLPRAKVEDLIEALINMLDIGDADPDLEIDDDWENEDDRPDFPAVAFSRKRV